MCRTWLGVALVALLVLPACGRADAPAGGRRTATGPGLSASSSDMELHGVRWIDGQGREMSGPPELGRGDRSVLFFDVAAKRTKADLEAFAALARSAPDAHLVAATPSLDAEALHELRRTTGLDVPVLLGVDAATRGRWEVESLPAVRIREPAGRVIGRSLMALQARVEDPRR